MGKLRAILIFKLLLFFGVVLHGSAIAQNVAPAFPLPQSMTVNFNVPPPPANQTAKTQQVPIAIAGNPLPMPGNLRFTFNPQPMGAGLTFTKIIAPQFSVLPLREPSLKASIRIT